MRWNFYLVILYSPLMRLNLRLPAESLVERPCPEVPSNSTTSSHLSSRSLDIHV
jgi:hypothetical protein